MWKATPALLMMISVHAPAAPLACLIGPEKVAEVGAPGIGIIENISVDRGDTVRAGQTVARLRADVERASVGIASVRAQAQAELKAATTAQDLAQIKLSRSRELFNVGFISKEAVDQAEIEARLAQARVAQAREGQDIYQRELALSHSQLAQRRVVSTFDGIVVDRFRTEGERVEREPIVRIAKIDPLRVDVVMPASQFGQISEGASATVRTDVAGAKELSATVSLVDRIIDAASNTFRVRLTLPNPQHRIPAGLRCTVVFDTMPDSVQKADAAPVNATLRLKASDTLPNRDPMPAKPLPGQL
jgi:RND family efflux transporter MFP subunit